MHTCFNCGQTCDCTYPTPGEPGCAGCAACWRALRDAAAYDDYGRDDDEDLPRVIRAQPDDTECI